MVNTQVSNPEHKKINRQILYHKRKAMHFLEILVLDGNEEAQKKLDYHHLKIRELKLRRKAFFGDDINLQ